MSLKTPAPVLRELPPRARRIPMRPFTIFRRGGTTSACAENTETSRSSTLNVRNYLRVRGEYFSATLDEMWQVELPPRARRIQPRGVMAQSLAGTTSACAENTHHHQTGRKPKRNYLRVRGEYLHRFATQTAVRELPPRARRIHPGYDLRGPPHGTTSACAENTEPVC